MIYTIAKPFLFMLDPEKAHYLSLKGLKIAHSLGLTRWFPKPISKPRTVMGLSFPNSIGLAAGLDKNGDYIDALSSLGFGFIEIGTVTPKPQMGNPRPRLFRLVKEKALINRLGFNNKGVDYVENQLKKMRYRGLLGINIGKNKDTPNERALEDYLFCFRRLWPFANYITINISSPNTPHLRALQHNDALVTLLSGLKAEQTIVMDAHQKYVPLVVKISPDLSPSELENIAAILLQLKIDGVIATNTTLAREGVENSPYVNESGGLSGKPLQKQSTAIIRQLHTLLQNQLPIIAVGGILDQASTQEKLNAGATLIQVYTGLIYEGPGLVKKISA